MDQVNEWMYAVGYSFFHSSPQTGYATDEKTTQLYTINVSLLD